MAYLRVYMGSQITVKAMVTAQRTCKPKDSHSKAVPEWGKPQKLSISVMKAGNFEITINLRQ